MPTTGTVREPLSFMSLQSVSLPAFRGPNLEARATSGGGSRDAGPHVPSFRRSQNPRPRHNPPEPRQEPPPPRQRNSTVVNEDDSDEGAAGAPNKSPQPEWEWKPWKVDEPYRSEVPKDDQAMENLVKAMKESDDGMCTGWVDQIDTLIIFAGLFSATVTAFTIESYQWLAETPADTLARLQLRALLVEAHDSTTDRLPPATFTVSPSEVLINTLWFASLTLTLTAVVISILCKQWLYEYQRYDNFTTLEAFLVRGLRYRGLQAWRVPVIISSLPVLLQGALVLFLIGVLVLLWPLQPVVASIVTVIVGAIFLFLGVTTVLPAIQYVFPTSLTQCAYKSSQSWSFLSITAFWLFDFSMFTNWAMFDRWEVTCVCTGMGHTLSRAYELLSNSVGGFQSIYNFLADISLKPTIDGDCTLLFDFVDGLDAARRDKIIKAVSQTRYPYAASTVSQRSRQLHNYIARHYRLSARLKPASHPFAASRSNSDRIHPNASHKYHFQAQKTLSQLLKGDIHLPNPTIFNRFIEHSVRCLDVMMTGNQEGTQRSANRMQLEEIFGLIQSAHRAHICLDPGIASHLVEMYSHLLKTDWVSEDTIRLLSMVYSSFVESYRQHH